VGLKFFSLSRGAQHPLGPENPLKSIYFTTTLIYATEKQIDSLVNIS